MNLITNFGKKVAQIALVVFVILFVLCFIFSVISLHNVSNFVKAGIILIFFLPVILFIYVIRLVKSDYKKLCYNSIIVACFMFSLFLSLLLLENSISLKANLPTADFILFLFISYVLTLKKSKELLPETGLKLISCLNIDVPIGVIIIIALFNYCFACSVAVILIYLLRNVKNVKNILIYLKNYHMKEAVAEKVAEAFAEAVLPLFYFFQLFITSTFIFLYVYDFTKLIKNKPIVHQIIIFLYDFTKLIKINGITVNKPNVHQIIQIILGKPILIIFLLVSSIVVSSVNYSIVYIVFKLVDKFNIVDKLKK